MGYSFSISSSYLLSLASSAANGLTFLEDFHPQLFQTSRRAYNSITSNLSVRFDTSFEVFWSKNKKNLIYASVAYTDVPTSWNMELCNQQSSSFNFDTCFELRWWLKKTESIYASVSFRRGTIFIDWSSWMTNKNSNCKSVICERKQQKQTYW